MSKGLIPHESAYNAQINLPNKKSKKKDKIKQPKNMQYKQRAEEIHHTQTSRGH